MSMFQEILNLCNHGLHLLFILAQWWILQFCVEMTNKHLQSTSMGHGWSTQPSPPCHTSITMKYYLPWKTRLASTQPMSGILNLL